MSTPEPPNKPEPQADWTSDTIDVSSTRQSPPHSARRAPDPPPPLPSAQRPVPSSRRAGVPEPPLPGPGTVIANRFRLDESIGSGGMGTVYKAYHLTLGIPVAVKLLHRHIAAHKVAMRRFRREAQVTSRIQHANIVRVLDFGEEHGLAYIAMEYIQGVSLGDWLFAQGAPPPIDEVSSVFLEILSAFEAAHALGVVHRDLEPENAMLATDSAGRRVVKVVDFGLAHVDAEAEGLTPLTQSDQVAGTPWYMSPEQCRSLVVGPLSDIYALGCVLTTLLQLRPPFHNGASAEIMAQHMYLPVPPLQRPPGAEPVPVLLEQLRLDMLAKDPERRPLSASAVRARFVAALDPAATEALLPGRKADMPSGDRTARAVSWEHPPQDRTLPTAAADALRVALLRTHSLSGGGIDDDCVLGLAAQQIAMAPWDEPSGDAPEGTALIVLDAGDDFDRACDMLQALRARYPDMPAVVCLDGLTTDRMNGLIEAGATDVQRYPVRASDLARKIGRALRQQPR